tara:strand:- start:33402 stop:33905 length:504 start_codon:yes stop_codon:yes gene_type:complete
LKKIYKFKNVKLFFWAIFIQIIILNNIQLSGYINPYYYLIFILSIPNKTSNAGILILSFLIGLVIDIFSNSYGIHSFASVTIAYIRIIWSSKIIHTKTEDDLDINNLPINLFLPKAFIFIIIHHFILFFLERWSLNDIFSIIEITFISSLFTFVLFIIHKLFSANRI